MNTLSDEAVVTQDAEGNVVLHDPVFRALLISQQTQTLRDLYLSDPDAVSRLEARAVLKTAESSGSTAFGVVIIDMDDPLWSQLGDVLMPNIDWNVYRMRGLKPLARGVVPLEILDEMMQQFRKSEPAPYTPPVLKGTYTVVFAEGTLRFFWQGAEKC